MALNLHEEKQILAKAKSDKNYLAIIFDAYAKDIYAYILSLSKNKLTAEDITSQTFKIALEKIDKFVWRGISIKYWLFRVAHNELQKTWRKENKIIFDNSVINNSFKNNFNDQDFLNQLITQDQAERISSFLNQLPPFSQEVIDLKIWQEFSFKEIAEITGQNQSKVKMAYYRGLKRLKKLLGK